MYNTLDLKSCSDKPRKGSLFESTPISESWKLFGPSNINGRVFQLSMGSINMVLDVLIVCLPISVVRTLHMTSRRKWSLVGIFSLGFLCVIL